MSVVVALTLLVGGCGGGEEVSTTAAMAGATSEPPASVAASSTTVVAEPQMSPADIGDQIGATYVDAIEHVVAALADRPDAPAALAALRDLKERYVGELVELGRLREALGSADRSLVDARVGTHVFGISPELFAEYQTIQADYTGISIEVADLVMSFNIITQYASFDLLRKQEPDEAARLLGE